MPRISTSVSIPFIAGQWSLLCRRSPRSRPSWAGFNPLHCGAVVASDDARWMDAGVDPFQSPSLRGSGRFGVDPAPVRRMADVSIPFIAGQWSLHAFSAPALRVDNVGFNPLHCGAVVASRAKREAEARKAAGFNPLHCGAVVASLTVRRFLPRPLLVSIPFIAGQWSLRVDEPTLVGATDRFNPLHCGAVVASLQKKIEKCRFDAGFNPLHCGAVVASLTAPSRRTAGGQVSIPFIAGQWSLHRVDHGRGAGRRLRFNPLHCGAVVASPKKSHGPRRTMEFQSPSLRGSGRFGPNRSIRGCPQPSFNPLHCGAVVASLIHPDRPDQNI